MKNTFKKSLTLALAVATLLTGCEDDTKVQNGEDRVAKVTYGETNLEAIMEVQSLYETLKASNAGSKAVSMIIKKIAEMQYKDYVEGDKKYDATDIRRYRTKEVLKEKINEFFQDAIDSHNYDDKDGNFDANLYKKYVEESLDYEVITESGECDTEYATDEMQTQIKYNYNELVNEKVIPQIYEEWLYEDYLLGSDSSKITSLINATYVYSFEYIKVPNDDSKENNTFTEAIVSLLDSYTGNQAVNIAKAVNFDTTNSAGDAISVNMDGAVVTYNGEEFASASNAYKFVEDIMIAYDLHKIDLEVKKARNYDLNNDEYKAYTETEKEEAKSLASTYSNSNAHSIAQGEKEKKIDAEQGSYYEEMDVYTSSEASSALPSAISSLRGSKAETLIRNTTTINGEKYLLPKRTDSKQTGVYLDTSGDQYVVCHLQNNGWYGKYEIVNPAAKMEENEITKTVSSSYKVDETAYHLNAYRNGTYVPSYSWDTDNAKIVNAEEVKVLDDNYAPVDDAAKTIIKLVQHAAKSALTTTYKTDAIVALIEAYGLEINDQDVYDYVKGQYPDLFDEDED